MVQLCVLLLQPLICDAVPPAACSKEEETVRSPDAGLGGKAITRRCRAGREPGADPAPCPAPRQCFAATGIVFLEVEDKRDLGALLLWMQIAKRFCDRHFFSAVKFIVQNCVLSQESWIFIYIFFYPLHFTPFLHGVNFRLVAGFSVEILQSFLQKPCVSA